MNKMKFRYFRDKQKLEPQFKLHTDEPILTTCERKFKVQNDIVKELSKSLDTYACCVKKLINSIESMYDNFALLYENDWEGNSLFTRSCRESLQAWQLFLEEFKVNILKNVENYLQDFPAKKKSIERRNKRAIEYQKQKHYYESIKKSKRSDMVKLEKLENDMKSAQKLFEEENTSLKEDLPKFINQRIQIYTNIWGALILSEEKLFKKLLMDRDQQKEAIIKLQKKSNTDEYNILKMSPLNSNLISTKQITQSSFSLYTTDSNFDNVSSTTLNKSESVWDVSDGRKYDLSASSPPINSATNTNATTTNTSSDKFDSSQLSRAASYQIVKPFKQDSTYDDIKPVKKRISFNHSKKPQTNLNIQNQISHHESQYSLNYDSDVDQSEFTETINCASIVEHTYPPDVSPNSSQDPVYMTVNKASKKLSNNFSTVNVNKNNNNNDSSIGYTELPAKSGILVKSNSNSVSSTSNTSHASNSHSKSRLTSSTINNNGKQEEEFFYKVEVRYNYQRQDNDELDLKRNDIILVLPWESEDQKEDGWLFGENINTKVKGLFPENHTIRAK